MNGELKQACDAITGDLRSSLRHWREVRDAARVRANDINPVAARRRAIAIWELEVAQAAVRLIEHEGRAPRSLVMGEAADELGVPFPKRDGR